MQQPQTYFYGRLSYKIEIENKEIDNYKEFKTSPLIIDKISQKFKYNVVTFVTLYENNKSIKQQLQSKPFDGIFIDNQNEEYKCNLTTDNITVNGIKYMLNQDKSTEVTKRENVFC
eukprot:265585_1